MTTPTIVLITALLVVVLLLVFAVTAWLDEKTRADTLEETGRRLFPLACEALKFRLDHQGRAYGKDAAQ